MTSAQATRPALEAALRAAGMRVTTTRQRVYAEVARTPHATPEALIESVNASGPRVPPSSVYRALEALEAAGVVTHTHLDHHAPTYHLAEHHRHLHLVCRVCGAVRESEVGLADELVAALEREHGFAADVTHMAIQGECSSCRT
ncbi:MAG: transcriptional repressor [Actinomycetales bacterium]|nr:transcriptional repressor [Tetrasphaera sp.]NLW99795.1 transcriptional repressor [Actinomycetales bacterium]